MDNALELKLYSNADLAIWFGIKTNSFTSHKEQKLEELKEYADFEIKKAKVLITKIKKPFYIKGSPSAKKIHDEFFNLWNADGYDTCANVGKKAIARYPNEVTVREETAAKYATLARDEYVGKPFGAPGKKGYCEYEPCKKNADGTYTPFTEEEKAINKKLLIKYFSTASEKTIYINDMIKSGEIDKAEAWDEYNRIIDYDKNFNAYIAELTTAIGSIVAYRTTHIYQSAWEATEDELNK